MAKRRSNERRFHFAKLARMGQLCLCLCVNLYRYN